MDAQQALDQMGTTRGTAHAGEDFSTIPVTCPSQNLALPLPD